MNFQIRQPKLSPNCKNNITCLLNSKRIRCDVSGMLNKIELWISRFNTCQKNIPKQPKAKAKNIRQDVCALMKVLQAINPETKRQLENVYIGAYPLPPPPPAHQTRETRLTRNYEGNGCEVVPLEELMERLLKTCQLMEIQYHPRKGALTNWPKVLFTAKMIEFFEHWTKTKVTSVPSSVFDTFLAYILEDVAGESNESPSHRKLIETAFSIAWFPPYIRPGQGALDNLLSRRDHLLIRSWNYFVLNNLLK